MSKIVTPYDLSSASPLIDLAGTNPTTSDLRGTVLAGGAREWGALEYVSDLSVAHWIGRKFVIPFDLASTSPLVDLAGTSPTTTDLRGAVPAGAAREWGALEYDGALAVDALVVVLTLAVGPRKLDCSLQSREIALVVDTRETTLTVEGRG